ncbi:MAG TPA: glycosyltransferase [Bryobacteraceae bacterium]|nr:glycosyltransferase [Bryobacteraceae bacterium]
MRCAIVHYWLLGMRGGEKVVEELCRVLPTPDIFTLFYDPERVSPFLRSHRVTASFLNPLRRYYRSSLPLAPIALEHFDLRGYDLVVSSESGPAKGVLTSSHTRHVCYCHTPMRYLWDLYPDYLHEWTHSRTKRLLMMPIANYLRLWDAMSAMRVDQFIANSRNVQNRIWKAYRRPSEVIHPPVDVETFYSAAADDYYLIVSELVSYKRIEDAVRCFTRTGRRLKVAGGGPEYARLKRLSGPTVEFCGRVGDPNLRDLYARARAVILTGEEDFGIVPVEALASGKAVIALGKGGVLETVPVCNPPAGFFYSEPGEYQLEEALKRFEQEEKGVFPAALRFHASQFSKEVFHRKISSFLFGSNTHETTTPEFEYGIGLPDGKFSMGAS